MSDDELNEIFRVFGHAAFYAFTFESELAALAGTLHVMTHPYLSKAEIRQYDAMLRRRRTAGELIKEELKALTKEVPDWGKFLTQMTDVRNRLMHRFYEEQLPNLHSAAGRKFALKELKIMAVQLRNGGRTVKTLYLSLAKEHFAFDEKRFREHVENMVKRWID